MITCCVCGLHLTEKEAVRDMQSIDLFWHVVCLAKRLAQRKGEEK